MIRIERHALGRRTYVFGRRLHHGPVGLALIVAGTLLVAHDLTDFPWTDRRNH